MDFYSVQGEYDEEDSGGEEQEPCPGDLRHATGIRVPRCGLVLTSRLVFTNAAALGQFVPGVVVCSIVAFSEDFSFRILTMVPAKK
jgi:hypothetical protein